MYYWRVFLWENGHKSTEYTKHVVAPIFLEDKLDETLDSGEVVLKAMPIATRNAFPPKTKFRLERYTTEDYTDTPRKWDLVVEHDDVEEYEGCPEICTHRVNLIEASVIAQGMHVDNIALTYELQDVDLNYRTTLPDEGVTVASVYPGGSPYNSFTDGGHSDSFNNWLLNWNGVDYAHATPDRPSVTYFETNFKFEWSNTGSLNGLIAKINASTAREFTFDIPKLTAYAGTGDAWQEIGEIPTKTTVTWKKYKQRARQDSDGRYIADTQFEPEEIDSGTLFDKTSFPTSSSGFVSLPLRTKVENNILYICETPYIGAAWSRNDTKSGFRILNSKWIGDTEATGSDNTEYVPISYATANQHYTQASFTTFAMADEEAISTGDDGNVYISWYEYELQTREAFYASGGTNIPARQYYSCTGYWRGLDTSSLNDDYWYFNKTRLDRIAITSYPTQAPSVYVKTSITATVEMIDVNGGKFLMKGKKYSCYELLKKALLTVDTQIINNTQIGIDELGEHYPITISAEWVARLQAATMQETIFEQKNLWEILLQIGYYLHAIPYMEFADDGTDRFLLSFRQLGDTRKKDDTSRKITVFNSQNLSDYFTQYDSYVTNLFSPQNVVDEWLVAKTSDSSYLAANDTAEFSASRPIIEIMEFDIQYGNEKRNALENIFEESVYQILTSDNPKRIQPAKGNAIYYKLGDNKILGLNYVPPAANSGTYYYALQEICRRLFGDAIGKPEKLKFNDLLVHVKYKTQDELRVSQVRPDIQNFMRNSSLEKYPHHEQYYGQQDKIIDSERFTENLFGQLIRVGNTEYQRQEYADAGSEKESGDLVDIYGEPYYVIATENENYADAIKQKVTYSKNFNQLAKIVTIPSEPRFYEVSERSKVRREVRVMEFVELTTTKPTKATHPRFLSNSKWKTLIKGLIFNKQTYTLPNFAYTKFQADHRREHTGGYGQLIPANSLFPSGETIRDGVNSIKPLDPSDHAECVVSLLHYPTRNGIIFEWDMEDNFKAGDFIDAGLSGVKENGEAYVAQQSHRYVDVMGRADLFTFRLFNKTNWTIGQARQLPKAAYVPTESESDIYLPSPYTIGLDKDNREAISFNFQINLLHRTTEQDSEDFITLANLFGEKESALKMCLLDTTQSMFNQDINASLHNVLADNVQYSLIDNATLNAIEIRITEPTGVDLAKVKAIALYEETQGGSRYAYIIKNIEKTPTEQRLKSWWLVPVFSD